MSHLLLSLGASLGARSVTNLEDEDLMPAMQSERSPSILEQYDDAAGRLQDFASKLEALIRDILTEAGMPVHSVTSRVKDRSSLQRKLRKPGSDYKQLSDITDVVGVRITTYMADDVDRVAGLIENEFIIDRAHSTDKRAIMDPDRFGYLSLHHVITLSADRTQLTEYRRFPALKAEVQTRSILQHAWAEIEHDLGYKAGEVPRSIRRKFSRLAGLLELADQEFCSIRNELRDFERVVAEHIATSPATVPVEKPSLEVFVAQNPLLRSLDDAIAAMRGARVSDEGFLGSYAGLLVGFGIHTISDLQRSLSTNEARITAFAKGWFTGWPADHNNGDRGPDDDVMPAGISLFYLLYLLAADTRDVARVKQYLEDAGIELEDARDELARRVLVQAELLAEGL